MPYNSLIPDSKIQTPSVKTLNKLISNGLDYIKTSISGSLSILADSLYPNPNYKQSNMKKKKSNQIINITPVYNENTPKQFRRSLRLN